MCVLVIPAWQHNIFVRYDIISFNKPVELYIYFSKYFFSHSYTEFISNNQFIQDHFLVYTELWWLNFWLCTNAVYLKMWYLESCQLPRLCGGGKRPPAHSPGLLRFADRWLCLHRRGAAYSRTIFFDTEFCFICFYFRSSLSVMLKTKPVRLPRSEKKNLIIQSEEGYPSWIF